MLRYSPTVPTSCAVRALPKSQAISTQDNHLHISNPSSH